MRSVSVTLRIADQDAEQAFDRVSAFSRYPELTDVIRSVGTRQVSPAEEISDWEVYFRNGVLCWSESDLFDRDTLTIAFEQVDGDFAEFRGTWRTEQAGPDCLVVFAAEFDFGIPSLAGILDPVAQRVFKETIARVVLGLFAGGADVVGDEAVARAVADARVATTAGAPGAP
ncbi:SRPBCC family protein [Streptomyces spiramenti]|uniref:Cyclase n=1 Tax=Streptomyces spiramenti TaxID=2720606 RepID=A0ABX1AMC1_9ACTN|nr:cyclase [Streptomyces spiramenti]